MKLRFNGGHFWLAEVRRGFMEQTHIRAMLRKCEKLGAEVDLDDVTYYVGHETIVTREGRTGQSSNADWTRSLYSRLDGWLWRPLEIARLMPTARSLHRW